MIKEVNLHKVNQKGPKGHLAEHLHKRDNIYLTKSEHCRKDIISLGPSKQFLKVGSSSFYKDRLNAFIKDNVNI